MTTLHIEYHLGRYQCVATSNGIADRRLVGPRFGSPREAARFLDSIADAPPRPESDRTSLGAPGPAQPEADRRLTSGGMDEGSAAEPAAGFWATPPTESGG